MAAEQTGGGGPQAHERGVITLGFGDEQYGRMAKALARSIRLHNPDLPLAVVTDHLDDEELKEYFDVLIPFDPQYGKGVQQKLSLDRYTPFDLTLYLDADSLVVRDLGPVFDLMGIVPFGVVGFPVVDGFYWVEVQKLIERFEVPYIGRFNAGLICFGGDGSSEVFDTARRYVAEGRLEGMPGYRGAPSDEIPLSAALGHHGIVPIYDDGDVMRAPEPLESRITIDTMSGVGRFKTKSRMVEPAVMHFAYLFHGTGLRGSIYRREVSRLLGEPVTPVEHLKCALSQVIFALESSSTVRNAWKRNRSIIRRRLKRSAHPTLQHPTSAEVTTGEGRPSEQA